MQLSNINESKPFLEANTYIKLSDDKLREPELIMSAKTKDKEKRCAGQVRDKTKQKQY